MTMQIPFRVPTAELANRLESLDGDWTRQGVPLSRRAAESFKGIYGSVRDEYGRQNLFDDIHLWYVNKYGLDAMKWDGIIGRIPILLRERLYVVRVPFVTETTLIRFSDRFENLAPESANSLTPDEFDTLRRRVSIATSSWQAIYTLSVDDTFLGLEQRHLVRRAVLDLEASCSILSASTDTQGAIFNAHAASEKFLKVAFKRANSTVDTKDFGHHALKLFKQLIAIAPRYSWLVKQVELLETQLGSKMSIRYEILDRSVEEAISAIHASLFLCGTLATIWTFDHLRGSDNATFTPARFYTNGTRSHFYCKSIDGDSATLLLFHQDQWTGRRMMDMTIPISASSMYLEVTDSVQDEQLRVRLLDHLRNPGRQVSPQDAGIKHTDSSDGVYMTAITKHANRSRP